MQALTPLDESADQARFARSGWSGHGVKCSGLGHDLFLLLNILDLFAHLLNQDFQFHRALGGAGGL